MFDACKIDTIACFILKQREMQKQAKIVISNICLRQDAVTFFPTTQQGKEKRTENKIAFMFRNKNKNSVYEI